MQTGSGVDVKPFGVIDNRVTLLIIAADYLVIFATIVIAVRVDHPVATLIAMVLIAGRQVAFLNLVHAASHYSLMSKRKMNDRVDLLVAYLILDGVRPYRGNHLPHHHLFNRKDPGRFEYLEDRITGHEAGFWRRTWEVFLKPFLGGDGIGFVRSTFDQAMDNRWWTLRLAIYWLVVVSLCAWAGWLKYLLLYWIVPLLWIYPVFYNWAELSDHFAVREDARNQQGLFYSLFIKGHEMYHAVHHLYPRIPFYRIKAASKHLQASGAQFEETRGFLDFLKILYRRTLPPSAAEQPSAPLGQPDSALAG
ncbi:MAG TPA: fatty acid desaturase [Thermoanaerobaculia bacterium]|nr:fatty acid desaturase [Thermoanaerobaculia bacterium]